VEVDHQAPVCESADIVINAPSEVVWDTLSDLRSWPRWMPGVNAMRVDEPLHVGTEFQWKAGPTTIKSEILECHRPDSIGWKGRTFGISALHVWRMHLEGGATKVFTEESWAGPLPSLLRRLASKSVKKALGDGLPALKAEAELRAQSMS
jgi:uncharacterized membrane protein